MAVGRRTAGAEQDLVNIRRDIAVDSPHSADLLPEKIASTCMLLADNPLLGRARPDIASEPRYLPIGNYLILYRELAEGIEVVRVVHGARRLDGML